MSTKGRRRERHLRLQPQPAADPATHWETVEQRPAPPKATAEDTFVFTEAMVRAGWSMRLHALLGEEVANAVGSEILTVAEAEVLLARLAVVIDQAVGVSDR
jgi:hypothetical protein